MQDSIKIKKDRGHLHHCTVDSKAPIHLKKLISAFRRRELTNFLEAAEQLNYFGNDAISLLRELSGEVA